MNKQNYLDTIAVKGKSTAKTSTPVISPLLAKVLIICTIVAIALLILAGLITGDGNGIKTDYSELAYTFQELDSGSSPIKKYSQKLQSPKLRNTTLQLTTSLTQTNSQIKNALPTVGLSSSEFTKSAKSKVDAEMTALSGKLEEGYYGGQLDGAFANAMVLELSHLTALQQGILKQTDSEAIAKAIKRSLNDLEVIIESYQDFLNSTEQL